MLISPKLSMISLENRRSIILDGCEDAGNNLISNQRVSLVAIGWWVWEPGSKIQGAIYAISPKWQSTLKSVVELWIRIPQQIQVHYPFTQIG